MKRRPAGSPAESRDQKSPHKLGRRLSAQLRGIDDPVELLQHVGGVVPDELSLERLKGVGQVVRRLQDVLELGHCRLLQGWECEVKLQVQIPLGSQ